MKLISRGGKRAHNFMFWALKYRVFLCSSLNISLGIFNPKRKRPFNLKNFSNSIILWSMFVAQGGKLRAAFVDFDTFL